MTAPHVTGGARGAGSCEGTTVPVRPLLLELCVDDVAGALLAEQAGIERVELCSALSEGGLTPSIGQVARTLELVEHVGVQVLVRPRPGHFVYDEQEVEVMEADIAAILALDHAPGVTVGIVVGALTAGAEIDEAVTRRLVAACGQAPVTFHRAFDLTSDAIRSLATVADLGASRVLTSGGAATAAEGTATLARLVAAAGERVTILAGGGVRAANAARIVASTGVSELHVSARAFSDPVGGAPARLSLTGRAVPTGKASRPDPDALDALVEAVAPARGLASAARARS